MGNNLLAEKYFFDAAQLLGQRDFDDMPSAAELKGQHSFSDEFETKIAKILSSFDNHSNRKSAARRILLIAAIIALLLAFAMSSSALKERAYELFTMQTFSYTDVDYALIPPEDSSDFSACYEESDYLSPSDELTVLYELSALPEGYRKLESIVNPTSNMIVYTNESENLIIFKQCVMESSYRIDTENAEVTEFSVDGIDFYCSYKNGYSVLLWAQEGYSFSISCPFSPDEAVKFARSIKLQ